MKISEQKDNLRCRIKQKSGTVSSETKQNNISSIHDNFLSLSEYASAKTIHTYISSFHWEVDTFELIKRFFFDKKRVIVPITKSHSFELTHTEIKDLDNLRKSELGIWEPVDFKNALTTSEMPELIIVPGLAFDRRINRLGSGKGCYDRFLAQSKAFKACIVFPFQVIEDLPVNETDVPLDILISTDQVIRR